MIFFFHFVLNVFELSEVTSKIVFSLSKLYPNKPLTRHQM